VSLAFDANSLMHDLSSVGHAAAPKRKNRGPSGPIHYRSAAGFARPVPRRGSNWIGLPSALDDLAQIINERFQIACLFEGAGEVEIPTAEAARIFIASLRRP